MKKLKMTLLATLVSALALTACGEKDKTSDGDNKGNKQEQPKDNKTCENAWSGDKCDICKDTEGYGPDCTPYAEVKDKDGKSYKTAAIQTSAKKVKKDNIVVGDLIWMSENYSVAVEGAKSVGGDTKNDAIYGKLYTFEMASKAGFCPEGWRLPTAQEFAALLKSAGDNGADTKNPAFLALIAKSDLWYAPAWEGATGTDDEYLTTDFRGKGGLGFMALPAGACEETWGCGVKEDDAESDGLDYENLYAYFWTSTVFDPNEDGGDADTDDADTDGDDGSSDDISIATPPQAMSVILGLGSVGQLELLQDTYASVRCVKPAK